MVLLLLSHSVGSFSEKGHAPSPGGASIPGNPHRGVWMRWKRSIALKHRNAQALEMDPHDAMQSQEDRSNQNPPEDGSSLANLILPEIDAGSRIFVASKSNRAGSPQFH
jgi:hypothetical protein